MTHYSIAIDGPSGAGKSTLARALADRLGFFYVDTGAIYRTLGLYIARQGGDCGQKADVVSRLPEVQISMAYGEDGLQHMILQGEDVTGAIRAAAPLRKAADAVEVDTSRMDWEESLEALLTLVKERLSL